MLHLRYRRGDEKGGDGPTTPNIDGYRWRDRKKIDLADAVQYRTILHKRSILSPASQERRAATDMIQVLEFGTYRLSIVAYTRCRNLDSMPP